ncbi:hypothetical protein [Aneurinibacillus danicus]|uniref:Uncharacterized protein n=1 Tax=Aneurinibacillus danicus TaxID=267746 RepID=A0A511VCI9_9BACL|nr:hypothetical protein [Aneurinibacillus danicus]GEN36626.1 hypothetical protein ADA01nite_40860 [Aneurinibacillus danicus]
MDQPRVVKVSYNEENSSEALLWIDSLIEKIIITSLGLEPKSVGKILMESEKKKFETKYFS